MALHRLFWVPRGLDARHGVYVLQPQEELFASLALESHRMTCEIVGENLGTVPEEIEEAMARHGLSGMYVLQFALEPSADPPVRSVPRGVVASVNTHDMPTFAGFWEGHDVEDRLSSGLLDADEARSEREARARLREGLRDFLRRERLLETDDPAAVLEAALAWLARGPARHVVASLEDLWLEPEPQNVPGTSWEKPNWRRKARLSLDEITADREVARVLERLNQSRGEASREHADQGASP